MNAQCRLSQPPSVSVVHVGSPVPRKSWSFVQMPAVSGATSGQPSRQNSLASSMRSRIAWFCSRVWGRHVGERRSSHHECASSLSFVTEIVAPGMRRPSQRSMCSSDRKRFMVLQVKTMSSHHAAAGTGQWNSNDASEGRCSRTSTRIASPQSAHEHSMSPSTWSAAQMPKASHAQFAYHHRPAARTRYAVGTAENGFAIRMSPLVCRTSACASWSRCHASSTAARVVCSTSATSSARGARPSSTKSAYVALRRWMSPPSIPHHAIPHATDAGPIAGPEGVAQARAPSAPQLCRPRLE